MTWLPSTAGNWIDLGHPLQDLDVTEPLWGLCASLEIKLVCNSVLLHDAPATALWPLVLLSSMTSRHRAPCNDQLRKMHLPVM